MNHVSKATATVLVVVSLAIPVAAGADDAALPTSDELQSFRARIERSPNLDDGLRARIIEHLDTAGEALAQADANRAASSAYSRQLNGIDVELAALKAELERPDPEPELHVPVHPTVDQAEDALARERARLAANLAALRDQQQAAASKQEARTDVARRLGELDLELELVNRELGSEDQVATSEIDRAARLSGLARRGAIKTEIDMLRIRHELLSKQSTLIPLEVDLAQRRVAASKDIVRLHEALTHQLRAEEARASLESVRKITRDLSEALPQVSKLAEETEELAEMYWGPQGIVTRSEETARDIDATRTHMAQLNRIAELTVRKFEAYGHRGSVKRWWPEVPAGFPEHRTIQRTILRLDREIPEVEHRLITCEQDRSEAHVFGRRTLQSLHDELGDGLSPELAHRVRTLLAIRQDLLDRMISTGRDYSNNLIEQRSLAVRFFRQYQAVEGFLFSRVLWSRSVPRPIVPRLENMTAAAAWLTSPSHLDAVVDRGELGRRVMWLVLILALLVLMRRPLNRRIAEIADRVEDPSRDGFHRTIEALLITAILAAPIPLALHLLSAAAQRFGDTPYWFAAAAALSRLAVVAALLEAVRQVFAPRGLAEVHFGWPISTARPSRRVLVVAELLALPLLLVAFQLIFAGMRLNSPAELQLYNNTLGRAAFIAALTILGLSVIAMAKPARSASIGSMDPGASWFHRVARYPVFAPLLAAYPIVILTTFVPVILAAFGYYFTGVALAYQMLRTLVFVFAVVVGGGVVRRWLQLHRRRQRQAIASGSAAPAESKALDADQQQLRQLFRFAITVAIAIGLLVIWNDALPMFESFKRVQLLPTVKILKPTESLARSLGFGESDRPAPAAEAGSAAAVPASDTSEPGGDGGTGPSEIEVGRTRLSLWNLLEAILAAIVTIVLVRNIPGVIETALKRRSSFDKGARFAVSTLVRYTITIVGFVVVFGLLGIGWSKVQWLAAALTFGLGFGLQEIVANFVSGLILLVERPVRVGDMVTVGNLMGRVSRIQIRATTITLLDRSEMVVPNKEFITTKLVNWTLSDSKRRIEIPLRIAYGTDLERVKELLVAAASSNPLVLEDPAPQALLIAFADDAINLELRFVVDFGNGIRAKDEVQVTIDRTFKEHGIEFAVPQLKLQLPGDAIRG